MEILKKGARSAFHGTKAGNPAKIKMEELYAAIEKKIKDAGYPRLISGEDV